MPPRRPGQRGEDVTSRTLTLGGTAYPVLLPKARDPRLHVAAVIVTIHVLGQLGLGFQVSVPQILAAILTTFIGVAIAFRRTRSFMWPASAMLTGSGVALILRVPGTPPDEQWSPTPGTCSPASPRSRCRRSTSSGTGARTSSTRRTSGWWSRSSCSAAAESSRSTSGGRRSTLDDHRLRRHPRGRPAHHRRLRLLPTPRRSGSPSPSRSGCWPPRALHDCPVGVRPRVRLRLLARDRVLARGLDLPVLHDHRPEDRAVRTGRPRRVRVPRRRGRHAAHGAAGRRVRHQGRPARRSRRRVRGPATARPGLPSQDRRPTTSGGGPAVS